MGILCADHATPSIRKVGTNFTGKVGLSVYFARELNPRSFVLDSWNQISGLHPACVRYICGDNQADIQ
jgi:hypothetical protein